MQLTNARAAERLVTPQ